MSTELAIGRLVRKGKGPLDAGPEGERIPLSSRSPLLFLLSVTVKRLRRRLAWLTDGRSYARERSAAALPWLVMEHRSQLIRKLGDTDIVYQHNKVRNLRVACSEMSGILLSPGEVLSFCRITGKPTARKGYLPGLELSSGRAVTGMGGGLCALSNLMHWMTLHSALEVTERHRHGFDPFPDSNRTLPFACGATIFYNYRDLQITNPTSQTYQFVVWVGERFLRGELRADSRPSMLYRIEERNHRFVRRGDRIYRCNELWRLGSAADEPGMAIEEELLIENDALVLYEPGPDDTVDEEED